MKCPFCDTEMRQGYLQTGLAIWSERKHKISLLPSRDEPYALRLRTPMLSPHHVKSDFCPRCKRIIIDSTSYECSENWDDA